MSGTSTFDEILEAVNAYSQAALASQAVGEKRESQGGSA